MCGGVGVLHIVLNYHPLFNPAEVAKHTVEVVKRTDFGASLPGFKFQFYHLLCGLEQVS